MKTSTSRLVMTGESSSIFFRSTILLGEMSLLRLGDNQSVFQIWGVSPDTSWQIGAAELHDLSNVMVIRWSQICKCPVCGFWSKRFLILSTIARFWSSPSIQLMNWLRIAEAIAYALGLWNAMSVIILISDRSDIFILFIREILL